MRHNKGPMQEAAVPQRPIQQQQQQEAWQQFKNTDSQQAGKFDRPQYYPPSVEKTTRAENKSLRGMLKDVYHIVLPENSAPGQEQRIVCPKCGGGSSGEKSFSISIDSDGKAAKWNCFRATCGYSGSCHVDRKTMNNASGGLVSLSSRKKKKDEPPIRPRVELEPLTKEMVEFFNSRGISSETLERNGIASHVTYDPKEKSNARIIAFPYFTHDLLVNIKYRTLDKRFWQIKGAEKVLYGLNDILGANEIIIVEGEMDKLAMEEAGFKNVVSVPDGAPARVKEGALPPAEELSLIHI